MAFYPKKGDKGGRVLKSGKAREGGESPQVDNKMVNNININFEKVDKKRGGGLANRIRFFL